MGEIEKLMKERHPEKAGSVHGILSNFFQLLKNR